MPSTTNLYFSNGCLASSSQYKNNKLHGKYASFYPNGQVRVHCVYKDGLLHGLYDFYNERGQLVECKIFSDGREISINAGMCWLV